MTDDTSDLLKYCPRGYKYTLVCAGIAKHALQGDMPADMRLDFLQHLEKMSDHFLTEEVIAMVEPLSAESMEIVREAQKLGGGKALDVYAEKFAVFADLNPSLIAALKHANRRRGCTHDSAQLSSDARAL